MSWIAVAVTGAGVAMKTYDYIQAGNNKDKAQGYLDELRKTPYEKMQANPALTGYYNDALQGTRNPQGLSAGEKSSFQANVANTGNTIYRNAVNTSGGNLSKFLSAAINPSIIGAQNQLVGQNAALKRSNQQSAYGRLGSAVSQLQGIDNNNVLGANNRKMMAEQAAGSAVAQNNAYQMNTLDSMGSDLIGGGLMMGMGGGFNRPPKDYGNNNLSYIKNNRIGVPQYQPQAGIDY